MNETKLNVDGMVCEGCEKRIINILKDIDGIKEVIASHKEGTVIIKSEGSIDKDLIKEKIDDIGFEVKEN